jgi:hypothetical protein
VHLRFHHRVIKGIHHDQQQRRNRRERSRHASGDRKYDYAGDITVDVTSHEPQIVGAERYLQRTIRLSEEVPELDFQSMVNIVERSPVTLLLQFAWSVRTEIFNAQTPTGFAV